MEPVEVGANYKWIALSNTTLGSLLASSNTSIILISMPAIFRGIHVDPLAHNETTLLLWLVLGYQMVLCSLLVTLGRISDMLGRVRMYNLGFTIFVVGSLLLTFAPGSGTQAALQLVFYRMVQGVGGAFLFANSAAILTDAFPSNQRGLALGLNQISAFVGQVVGLIAGGLLSFVDYRLVFFVSVPIALAGLIWSRLALRDLTPVRQGQRVDLAGNVTFICGLALVLVGVSYGQQPYRGQAMGWSNPLVDASLAAGLVSLTAFVFIELRVREPMFPFTLFQNRMFAAANLAGLLAAIGRGGLQLMLIIWLQGIWLPIHGYRYQDTPLWAGIYLLPMIAGILIVGPLSGILSDRFGARGFSTAGMCLAAAGFLVLSRLPANFSFPIFAGIIFGMGAAQGLFGAPNSTAIMNALPPQNRGSGSGMRSTLQQAGALISQAIFFTAVIVGLSGSLPEAMQRGLVANGVPEAKAAAVAQLPPTSALFSAFLGLNPLEHLLPAPFLASLPPATRANLLGQTFFPQLISSAFTSGLRLAFEIGAALSLLAALASLLRGQRLLYDFGASTLSK